MQLHTPVLLNEVLDLCPDTPGAYLDATLGYAGHASAILSARRSLHLYGIDQDPYALASSEERLRPFNGRYQLFKSNFANAFNHLKAANVPASHLAFVLADIGVSSVQLDFAERGFSFDSPVLDMRMDTTAPLDAATVLNTYPSAKLASILQEYGELPAKLAADIAASIVRARPLKSCAELSALIGKGTLKGRNVALRTLVFQAIRIEVNDELAALSAFLKGCEELENCTLAIITFHSLEDRMVKEAFKRFANPCSCDEFAPCCTCNRRASLGKILTKKPIVPTAAEIAANPRASCAKLRAFAFSHKETE